MKYIVEKKQVFLNPVLVISVIPWQQFAYPALTNQRAIPLFSLFAVKKVEASQLVRSDQQVRYSTFFTVP